MKRGHVTGHKKERTPANDWYQSEEAEAIMQALEAEQVPLAIGRILRLGSRPAQAGDSEDYERCREIIMAAATQQD